MLADIQKKLLGSIDDELDDIIKSDYDITLSMIEDSIRILKDWYKQQQHLPQIDIDDRYFKRLLHRNAFRVEKTKIKLDNYFTARSQFTNIYPEKIEFDEKIANFFKIADILIVPQYTEDHCRVSVLSIRDCDPDLLDWEIAFKICIMLADLQLWGDNTAKARVIWDCSYSKLAHLVKLPLPLMKKFTFISQKCYGARLMSIHIINGPTYMNTLVNVTKMGLPKKISDRFYSHNSIEDLHMHISPKYLPKELGGQQKSYAELSGQVMEALKSPSCLELLELMNQFRSDESKRVNQEENNLNEFSGMVGTFRKIDID